MEDCFIIMKDTKYPNGSILTTPVSVFKTAEDAQISLEKLISNCCSSNITYSVAVRFLH